MKLLLRMLNKIEGAILLLVLVSLIGLTFAGVVLRYVFNSPFTWMEEVQLASLLWLTFLGGALAFRHYAHVSIEILVDALPPGAQRIVRVIVGVVVYLVLFYLAWCSIDFLDVFAGTGRGTPVLGIPYIVVYGIAPASAVLMAISYTTTEFAPAVRDLAAPNRKVA